jgi:hypothetical protein
MAAQMALSRQRARAREWAPARAPAAFAGGAARPPPAGPRAGPRALGSASEPAGYCTMQKSMPAGPRRPGPGALETSGLLPPPMQSGTDLQRLRRAGRRSGGAAALARAVR